MKVDNRTPSQQSDLTQMNARIKEKKKEAQEARRPKTLSGWVALSERMIKWFESSPDTRNFLAFTYRNGYTWSEFKSWRRESQVFSQAIETCMQICLERREKYLEEQKKLASIYIMEQPSYNPILYDYEMEKSAKQADAIIKAGQQIPQYQSVKEKRKEEKEKK